MTRDERYTSFVWLDLSAEIGETFGALGSCFDMKEHWSKHGFHIATKASHVGIRIRRVGRDPEKVTAHREYTRLHMRRLRRRRKVAQARCKRWRQRRKVQG